MVGNLPMMNRVDVIHVQEKKITGIFFLIYITIIRILLDSNKLPYSLAIDDE
jgi:hypothetical protein